MNSWSSKAVWTNITLHYKLYCTPVNLDNCWLMSDPCKCTGKNHGKIFPKNSHDFSQCGTTKHYKYCSTQSFWTVLYYKWWIIPFSFTLNLLLLLFSLFFFLSSVTSSSSFYSHSIYIVLFFSFNVPKLSTSLDEIHLNISYHGEILCGLVNLMKPGWQMANTLRIYSTPDFSSRILTILFEV